MGDEVICVDPKTGAHALTRITHIRSAERECGALTFGNTTLTVTSDHPLFDPGDCSFHPAGDWMIGQRTQLWVFDGERVSEQRVTACEKFVGVNRVFDITVASAWHTFVAEGVVVHNKQPADCAIPDGGSTNLASPATERPVCQCDNSTQGRWTCTQSGGVAICSECGSPDAGP
ncbi:MAG: Hint domain-containing protein [Myxococcota bacterium]